MRADESGGFTCPDCEKHVGGHPANCPHCRTTFLNTCACGASWHIADLKCPECGKTHTFRRRVHRPFYTRRKFKVLVVLGVLGVLVGVNVALIILRSPYRRRHEYLMSGHAAFERGDYSTAKLDFEEYVRHEPSATEAWFMLGLTHIHLGDPDRAEARLKRALKTRPEHALAHVALSGIYRRAGRLPEALRSAEQAVAHEPVPVQAWKALGAIYILLRDQDRAIDALVRVAMADPAAVESRLELADLYFSRAARGFEEINKEMARRRYKEVRDLCEPAWLNDPGNIRAGVSLAKALAGLGKLREAVRTMRDVVESQPGESEHRLLLARLQVAQGDHRRAVVTLDEAGKATPSPAIALELARVKSRHLDDPDGAETVLREAIGAYPESSALSIALVAHLRRNGDLETARVEMDSVLERFPGDTGVIEASADLHLAAGDSDRAAEGLRSAIAARPENLSARRKLVSLLIGAAIAATEKGDEDHPALVEVQGQIQYFLDMNPGDVTTRGWKARLAFAAGDFETSAGILQDLSEASRKSYSGLRILGISLLQSGKYAEASSALFAALAHADCPRSPDDFEIAYAAAFRSGQATRQEEVSRLALSRLPGELSWRIRLAESLLRARKPKEALVECKKVKDHLAGTRDVRGHLLAARVHQDLGELEEARRELEDAVAIRRDAETRGALYAFFSSIGKGDLAEAGFEALVGERPTDPHVALRYGEYLYRQSRRVSLDREQAARVRKRARAEFERALSLDPGLRMALVRSAELTIADTEDPEEAAAAADEARRRIAEVNANDPYLLYFEGKGKLLRREDEAARELLTRFVRLTPEEPAGFYYLGIALRRTGDLPRAKQQFLAALQLDPWMVEAKLELAALYFTEGLEAHRDGDWDEARLAFERVVAVDPKEPETRRFLAEICTHLGMEDRAMEEADRVLADRPEDRGALFLSGLLLARKEKFELAEARFRKLMELEPELAAAHLYLGVVLAENKQFDAGRDEILRAYELERDSDMVLRALVLCETAAGRSEELLRFVEGERDRTPDRAAVHTHLGWLYRTMGRVEDAVKAYRAAFRLRPEDAPSLAVAGAILADEGRVDDAIDLLDEGIVASPAPGRLLYLKARLLISQGRPEDGMKALERSLRAEPDILPAYRELGLLLIRAGRSRDGESYLLAGVQKGLKDPVVFFRLALLALSRGNPETAVHYYRQVLEIVPDDAATLNNLAAALSRSPDTRAEAIELARRARNALPAEPRVADTLGWALYLDGKDDAALELLMEAAKGLPLEPMVQHHAGMACHRLYRWEEAALYFRRALKLSQDYAGAREAKKLLEKLK